MDTARWRAVLVGGAVAVIAAAFISVLLVNRPRQGVLRETYEASRAAKAHLSQFEGAAVSTSPPAPLRAALARIQPAPPAGFDVSRALPAGMGTATVDQRQHERLATFVAQFIGLLHQGDGEAYADWMESMGAIINLDERKRKRHLDAFNRTCLKEGEAPRTELDREVFVRLFEDAMAIEEGGIRPLKFAPSEESLRVSYLEIPHQDFLAYLVQDPAEQRVWLGSSAVGSRPFWRSPVSIADIVERDGAAEAARVSLALELQGSGWTAVTLYLFWDPWGGLWRLHSVTLADNLDVVVSPII